MHAFILSKIRQRQNAKKYILTAHVRSNHWFSNMAANDLSKVRT